MTALRPEHDAGHGGSYEEGAYGDSSAFEAAVDGLADPLNDPLPGSRQARRQGRHRGPQQGEHQGQQGPQGGAQWVRAEEVPAREPEWSGDYYQQYAAEGGQGAQEAQRAPGEQQEWSAGAPYYAEGQIAPGPSPVSVPETEPEPEIAPEPVSVPGPVARPPMDDRTVGLRTVDTRRATEPEAGSGAGADAGSGAEVSSASGAGSEREDPEPRTGGRAERRKAAKGGRGRKRPDPSAAGSELDSEEPAPSRPLSRVEARRAARASKESPAVIASRVVGELFITFGVLMLLFVTYQLWWTNIRAGQYAGQETNKIQDGWAKGRQPGVFEPGEGFAILHIPKLDVVVPIAEGISKAKVLDHGMVGHYSEGSLKTAMPSDKQGNFAVAGHRNTHGEPFRYINQLKPGDEIIVETQDAYYTYDMASILPQTPPSNVSVIRPVPPGSGFTQPGRYITLTTCTPEFTSTYRMIVWGKMVDERPRSKGKPDALVG